ncbi:MAG TPA: hypothetical protein VH722_07950 [Alphaproteobacteria bacterium]|jgi:hypothetical protein|nr:hypothetical protein [Alphaproteobacteria bacterium]
MSDVIRRLERDHPGLLSTLSEELNPSDLQSLLIEVARRRSSRRSPGDVVRDYTESRFFAPARSPAANFLAWDTLAAEVAQERFELLELSPMAPLGACAAVAKVGQNWSIATVRKGEVISDPTNILAIEAALRRKTSAEDIHLGASARVVRPQNYDAPGMLAHFRLFALVSSGHSRGSVDFEAEALLRHLDFYCAAIGGFVPGVSLQLAVTGEPLLTAARDFASQRGIQFAEEERAAVAGYYAGFCFHICAGQPDGSWQQLADGGLVDWGARLTGNAKERTLISGIGVEGLLAQRGQAER